MSKSNATENDLLAFIFTAVAIPWAAATELDIHIHTADPGEAGNSTTSECNYTGYLPVTVQRNVSDWTVTGSTTANDLLIQFPICTAGTNAATHVSVTPEGSTQIIYAGIQPQFPVSALQAVED
jgi:hypothetical protein